MREEMYQMNRAQRRKRNMQMFRRIHTRKIDRAVARHVMEVQGINHKSFRYQWRKIANMI